MCKKILLISCLALAACCRHSGEDIETVAKQHAIKLRAHFMGEKTLDVSTLIAETRSISSKLKKAGITQQANKFDSYTDVLMYGNNTIDESINDVISLVKNGYDAEWCTNSIAGNLKQTLFGWL